MRNINKGIAPFLLCSIMAGLSACGTSHVSRASSNGGADVAFPDPDKAVIKEGTFPAVDHLRNMAPGLTKNQVYDLLGRPHFREGVFGVREWDYIFHFRVNNQIVTCQYKVLFDEEKLTKSTQWSPAECAGILNPEASSPAPVAQKEPTRINLSGDALFAFSKSGPQDILADGRAQLEAIATQLESSQDVSIQVVGYTDRIGSDSENLDLSQRRAETVRGFLVRKGVPAESIVAQGAGESSSVTNCSDSLAQSELVACLQPDRRVELVISALK